MGNGNRSTREGNLTIASHWSPTRADLRPGKYRKTSNINDILMILCSTGVAMMDATEQHASASFKKTFAKIWFNLHVYPTWLFLIQTFVYFQQGSVGFLTNVICEGIRHCDVLARSQLKYLQSTHTFTFSDDDHYRSNEPHTPARQLFPWARLVDLNFNAKLGKEGQNITTKLVICTLPHRVVPT